MVLVVIPEKVAAQKSQRMIESLTAGIVGRGVVLSPVGQIRAENKQLNRAEPGRYNPERDQVLHWEPDLKHRVRTRHCQHLPNRYVLKQKTKPPRQQIRVAAVIVRVLGRRGVFVVQVVFFGQFIVVVVGKNQGRQTTDPSVSPWVMGSD